MAERPKTLRSPGDPSPSNAPTGEPGASAPLSNESDIPLASGEPEDAPQRSSGPSFSDASLFGSKSNVSPASPASASTIHQGQSRLFPALFAAGSLGAAAALLVAAVLWFGGFLPSREDNLSPVAARVAALELQARDLAGQSTVANDNRTNVEALAVRLAQVEGNRPAVDPQLSNRLGAAEAVAKSATDGIATLNRRIEELAAALAEARSRADATAANIQSAAAAPAGIDANKSEIEALKNRLVVLEGAGRQVERKDLDALATRLTALEQAVAALDQTGKTIQAAQAGLLARDRAVRLSVVASALNDAVTRGIPYAAELSAAKALAPPNALTALEPFAAVGLPPTAALTRELSDLLPTLQQTAGNTGESGGILEKLQANASRLVRIRPTTEQTGDDSRTVLSRIEIKAAQSDIAGALAEAAKLPLEQRGALEPWMRKAQGRHAAAEASRQFAADALTAVANIAQ